MTEAVGWVGEPGIDISDRVRLLPHKLELRGVSAISAPACHVKFYLPPA